MAEGRGWWDMDKRAEWEARKLRLFLSLHSCRYLSSNTTTYPRKLLVVLQESVNITSSRIALSSTVATGHLWL